MTSPSSPLVPSVPQLFVGIDVAKHALDLARSDTGELLHVANDPAGIGQIVASLQKAQPSCIVLEATGGLEEPLLSKEKSETLRTLGTAAVYDPNDNWRKTLKEQFPARVDLAIDNIAGESFNHVLDVMGNGGRISCVGRLAGPVPNFNTASLFFRNLRIGGISLNNLSTQQAQSAWQNILTTLNKTNAKPLIDHIYNFTEVPTAFARLKQGPMGKILIQIPQGS